jgi:hypothetical protein
LWRDAKALFLPCFHAFDERENVRNREWHVLIVFSRQKRSRLEIIFLARV